MRYATQSLNIYYVNQDPWLETQIYYTLNMACLLLILNLCGFLHRICYTLHLLGKYQIKYSKLDSYFILMYFLFFRLQYANSKAFKEFFWKVAGAVLCITIACIVSYSRYIF